MPALLTIIYVLSYNSISGINTKPGNYFRAGLSGTVSYNLLKGGYPVMKSKLAAALLVTLIALILAVTPAGANSTGVIVNGSFETGDYTGWTLLEDSGIPTHGTWGIAHSGETIHPGDSTYDYCDNLPVRQGSPGLPVTYTASEGNHLAYQLQNRMENHRMYQDLTLSPYTHILTWDMRYTNWAEEFFPGEQYLAVRIRDLSDNIQKTLFITTQGVNPQILP
jgi:hypothetical protein